MTESNRSKIHEDVPFNKIFWPLYILNAFQTIAYGGLVVLIVPLSYIFWPGEPSHSFEMGILYTILSWGSAFGGLIFGRLIDKYPRKMVILLISFFRGSAMLSLGFAISGLGIISWSYFMVFISIFGFFSGGAWPAVISLSNDAIPRHQRSRFFGVYEIVRNTMNIFGWLFATFLVQNGFWREYFWFIGISILIGGVIFGVLNKEPKRGALQEELHEILQNNLISYDFQITKDTMKSTMLSKTNRAALIEGIFTWILISSLNFLILTFIQNPPYNIAPFSTSVFMVVFGLTGGLLGQIVLARLCDKLAVKKPLIRLPIIVFSIVGSIISFASFFFLPWIPLTVEQGKNVAFLMTLPVIWMLGSLFFVSRSIFSLYIVNQSPVLQEINLPEAQGKITSWNQFLEAIGRGLGPLICGVLLLLTGDNFQITVLLVVLCILPGVVLWMLAMKWFPKDRKMVKRILETRAEVLKNSNNIEKD